MRKFSRYIYQLVWITLDQSCYENFSHHFNEQDWFPFLTKIGNIHHRYKNLLQTNIEILPVWGFYSIWLHKQSLHIDLLSTILTRYVRFKQRLQEKNDQKSEHSSTTGFQLQTQTISVNIFPNRNSPETNEITSPTKVTGISIPNSSALIPGITMPQQVPTKTIRSNSDNLNDSNTSEKFSPQANPYGVTFHHFWVKNTARLPFFQFNGTQRNIPKSNLFTEKKTNFEKTKLYQIN